MGAFFYRNPRLLILTVVLIAGAGLAAYRLVPRSEDPRMTNRYSFIITQWPGAGAERVESLVTEKIEEALFELEDVRRFRSTSSRGVSVIQLELKGHITEVRPSWSRVRDRLADTATGLPEGAGAPYLADTEEADAYSYLAAVTWEGEGPPPHAILKRLAQELESQYRFVPGTEFTRLFGAPAEEILVEFDTQELAALRIGPREVARQVAAYDPKVSAGRLTGETANLGIEVEGALDSVERVAAVPIRSHQDGRTLHLGDMAVVERATRQPLSELVYVDGRPAVTVAARMEAGLRIDRWAAQIREETAEFGQRLPGNVAVHTAFDQSRYVERSLRNLITNLVLGMAFVTIVTFILMGARAAIIVSAALPLSASIVITGMLLLGVTVHQMSIMGLVLSLGLLIDNAIIMVDAVRTRLDAGSAPREAIQSSSRHLLLPLTGSTITTVLAFVPLLVMPGGVGDFVGAIGITVSLSLISSFVLAFTVIPALGGYLLRWGMKPGVIPAFGRGWSPQWLTGGFSRALRFFFRVPLAAVAVSLVVPFIGFAMAPTLEEQFFPPSERDQFYLQFKLSSQASIEETAARARDCERVMLAHDNIEQVDWYIGVHIPRFFYNVLTWERDRPNVANAIVRVSHWRDVPKTVREIQTQLDETFPEVQAIARQLEQGPAMKAPIEARLEGPDLDVLHRLGAEVRQVLAQTPKVIHTDVSLRGSLPKVAISVDSAEAASVGLDRLGVAQALENALQGVTSGSVMEGTEELPVRVRIANAERGAVDRIASLEMLGEGPNGPANVPISALGEPTLVPEFSAITHYDNVRSNEVHGFVEAGVLPAQALADFRARLDDSGFTLPPGYELRYGGEEELRDEAVADLLAPVALLLVAMAGALVMAFNSFRLAALIAGVAFLSMGCGLASVWFFGYPLGFMALVGALGLVGVAINDSIVVLAAIRGDTDARHGEPEAVRRVVMGSSRHVIATTLTTMAGFAPLYLNGGAFWPPLATVIGGGVAGATLLALLLVPAVYLRFLAPRRLEPATG